MKLKIFGLVLLTTILVENPPISSQARMFVPYEEFKPAIECPLVDSVNLVANQLRELKQVSTKNLKLLRKQQQLINEQVYNTR